MNIRTETNAQASGEYLLLLGGVVIIAMVAIGIMYAYFDSGAFQTSNNDSLYVRDILFNAP